MKFARHALDVVVHDENIYAIGGFNGGQYLEVLYAGDKSWNTLAYLPKEQEGLAAALVEDRIYTFGSYGASDICQIYDIKTDTWQAGPKVPTELYWATAETVGNKIYLIPGYQPGAMLDNLFILDPVTHKWTEGAPLPNPIQIPASAVFGDDIYVFGEGSYFKYDTLTDTWSTISSPPSGHGLAAEAVTVGNKIYMIGGNSGYVYEAYTDTEIYDPIRNTWTRGPDMNKGRYQFGAVYLESTRKIYAIGGRDENLESKKAVQVLHLSLVADKYIMRETGGTINFTIDAGTDNALRKYFLLGSVSGTLPGVTFPTGELLPLNLDLYTDIVIHLANTPFLVDFYGYLDGNGQAAAQWNTLGSLPPGHVGISFYYAFLLFDPVDFTSNPAAIELVP
ncbi:MAG: Kelch repeat-containing protein [Planctomycetota bacterium]